MEIASRVETASQKRSAKMQLLFEKPKPDEKDVYDDDESSPKVSMQRYFRVPLLLVKTSLYVDLLIS